MKHLKMLGLMALAALALTAVGASTASATTLEVKGVKQTGTVTLHASLKAGTSAVLRDTANFSQNTCTSSTVHGHTTVYTGTVVTGPLTGHGELNPQGLTFGGCTRPVTVHDPGTLEIDWTGGTSGTVNSEEAQVTSGSPVGTLNCNTGKTTHIGTLTGVASGNATMTINAVLNCGIIPSAKWEATYLVTTPEGLGVIE